MNTEEVKKLFEGIPRKKFLFLPTPFHKLGNLTQKYGVEMYMKRDDLTGPSTYGGNKTRKLEFILGSALEEGIEFFISSGGYQTNSGMQLSVCCRKSGVKPILFLVDVTRQGVPPKEYRGNLLLNKILGCEIHYVERPLGEHISSDVICERLREKRKEELERKGHRVKILSGGVDAPEGWVAYVLAFKEIIEQSREMNVALEYLFLDTGTGGTLPGLLVGKFLLESDIKIVAVADSKPPAIPGKEVICNRVEQTFHQLGVAPPRRQKILENINIDWDFVGEDYAVPSRKGTDAIKELAREEGLMLDPVYTGKCFAALLDYIRGGKIRKGSKVVFLHTGGTAALFAEEALTGKIWE